MGRQGAVVGMYPDNAYEVEFSDEDGITIALLAVQRQDMKIPWLPAELPVEP
ncbi:DUF4926 domain-containing protein [Deinococcus marmoris]|uniref:DUF4926 domain-containing protein n=1 Tax=Deinococcus marmoris TaxID=249408 RepID=UPI0034C61211